MTSSTRLDDLRDAIAALDDGRALAVDVERLTEEALSSGIVTPSEALRELRSALNRGASGGIIARLQLDAAGPWKRVTPSAERAATLTQPRVTDVAPDHEPQVDARSGDLRSTLAAGKRPAADGARWIDAEPYSARLDDSKMPGQILGNRYRLDRQVDVGVMGTVYLATDLEADDALVAVTLLRPEFRSFSEALALLRTEVRVTRMLRHPNIARVYSLNSDRPGVYLVTEHLDGRTLEAHLRQTTGGLPLSETSGIIADVCAALDYAHDLDVVHGDVQPANVFITPAGRSTLLNFGLARVAATRNGRFDPRRLTSQTLAYASPEMLEGRGPDRRDDVYSLGCIIYAALSGAHPFESRTALEARSLDLVMPSLPSLSRDQNAALAQALAFERVHRMPSVRELVAALRWAADTPDPRSAAAVPAAAPVAAPTASPVAVAPVVASPVAAVPIAEPVGTSVAVAPVPPAAASMAVHVATTPVAAAVAVSEPAGVSDVPTLTESEPPAAPRTARRRPGRLPLPSIKATPRPPPPPPASRGYLMPLVIVVVLLLVAAGIGIFLYRRHATEGAATRSHAEASPASRSAPAASAAAIADSGANSADAGLRGASPPGAIQAGAGQAAAAVPVAAAQAATPPASADSKTAGVTALPLLRPLPKAAAAMANSDNCPYPREAMDKGLTGTVLLLVYVAPDGKPAKSKMDRTSGSDALDAAATRCVEQFARFAAPSDGTAGYWGRVRFKWSVGG